MPVTDEDEDESQLAESKKKQWRRELQDARMRARVRAASHKKEHKERGLALLRLEGTHTEVTILIQLVSECIARKRTL